MVPISEIRSGLSSITDALINDFPQEPSENDLEEGTIVTSIGGMRNPGGSQGQTATRSDEAMEDGDIVSNADIIFEIGEGLDESFPSLGGAVGAQIRSSIDLKGIDALGWYSSFHMEGGRWGIFIRVSGMVYLAAKVFSGLPASFATRMHLAYQAILNHELFHFATDYALAQQELAHKEPWWYPARKAFKLRTPNYCEVEECLANAYMLKAFRRLNPALRVPGRLRALRTFIREQPAGYSDGVNITPDNWDTELAQLAEDYGAHTSIACKHPLLWDFCSGYDWEAQFPIRPRIDGRSCPVYIVNDGARVGLPPEMLNFFSHIPAVDESDRFLKKLGSLSQTVRKAWERTKERLTVALTAGADFKAWPKGGAGVYSVRINDNYRVHLHRPTLGHTWTALDIGSHKEMGHG